MPLKRLPLLMATAAAMLLSSAASATEAGRVLFVSNRSGSAQVHVMNADGSGDRALTGGPQENTEPAWSPDGSRIAFTSYRDGNAEVYVMDADGANPRRLTHDSAADNAPSWTPDGRIVFRSMRSGWANFFEVAPDGTGLRALTASAQDKGPPMLSPDGRWIAFVVLGSKDVSEIQVLPSGGGEPRNLTAALSNNQKFAPVWSPDSRRLAYVEVKGLALNVRVVDADGSNPIKITDNAFSNSAPVWSPDGKRIAFVSSREGSRSEMARGDIYLMDADGSNAVNLTRHPAEDNYPAWAGDGQTILFVSLRDGNGQIYAVAAQGGESRRLTRDEGYDLMIRPHAMPSKAAAGHALLGTATAADRTR